MPIAGYKNTKNKYIKLSRVDYVPNPYTYQWSSRLSNLNPPNHTLP